MNGETIGSPVTDICYSDGSKSTYNESGNLIVGKPVSYICFNTLPSEVGSFTSGKVTIDGTDYSITQGPGMPMPGYYMYNASISPAIEVVESDDPFIITIDLIGTVAVYTQFSWNSLTLDGNNITPEDPMSSQMSPFGTLGSTANLLVGNNITMCNYQLSETEYPNLSGGTAVLNIGDSSYSKIIGNSNMGYYYFYYMLDPVYTVSESDSVIPVTLSITSPQA